MPDRADIIVDLSHHNTITSLDKLKGSGIAAIIHKSTEGTVFADETYQKRRKDAKRAGFLWGAYHFTSGEPPKKQVDFFLSNTDIEADELVAIDFEPSSPGTANMTLAQLEETVGLLKARLGRFPVVYGGHLLREALGNSRNSTLAQCPLWYARYAPEPVGVPKTWAAPTIWQYTDGKFGDTSKPVDGVDGLVDRDMYFGPPEQLSAQWPLT